MKVSDQLLIISATIAGINVGLGVPNIIDNEAQNILFVVWAIFFVLSQLTSPWFNRVIESIRAKQVGR